MTFETEYQLQEFREEQSELFNSDGIAFARLRHVNPMTRMLKLINQMEQEIKELENKLRINTPPPNHDGKVNGSGERLKIAESKREQESDQRPPL